MIFPFNSLKITKSKVKATFCGKIWQDQDLNQGPLDPYSNTLPTELLVLDRMSCIVYHKDCIMEKILWKKLI